MIKITSIDLDRRLSSFCANVRTDYGWYLHATRGSEKNLDIQRKIITATKAYAVLRNDLKNGCVLPSIVLAIQIPELNRRFRNVNQAIDYHEADILSRELAERIHSARQDKFYIIDGLQRTNALRQVEAELDEEKRAEFYKIPLRLEIWLNINFGALAYRMLLLNAGQRPMSIKHQVEVLSQNLKYDLQTIDNIEIIDAGRRRVRPGQFQLSKLSLAFQAWLQGSPNVDVRNTVVEEMLADSALETLGSTLQSRADGPDDDTFRSLVDWLVRIDQFVGPRDLEFLGSETVLQGIAAAVGATQRNETGRNRVENCLRKLIAEEDIGSLIGTDVIGLQTYNAIRRGIDPKKKNVGEANRNLVFNAFQEYFYTDGIKPMTDCWNLAGTR